MGKVKYGGVEERQGMRGREKSTGGNLKDSEVNEQEKIKDVSLVTSSLIGFLNLGRLFVDRVYTGDYVLKNRGLKEVGLRLTFTGDGEKLMEIHEQNHSIDSHKRYKTVGGIKEYVCGIRKPYRKQHFEYNNMKTCFHKMSKKVK